MNEPNPPKTIEEFLALTREDGDCRKWLGEKSVHQSWPMLHALPLVSIEDVDNPELGPRMVPAAYVLEEIRTGKHPEPGTRIKHICADPRCVEPSHIILE